MMAQAGGIARLAHRAELGALSAPQILLIVLITIYVVIAELARVIGHDHLNAMFFGPLPVFPKSQA
jgi:hypothetical protein